MNRITRIELKESKRDAFTEFEIWCRFHAVQESPASQNLLVAEVGAAPEAPGEEAQGEEGVKGSPLKAATRRVGGALLPSLHPERGSARGCANSCL